MHAEWKMTFHPVHIITNAVLLIRMHKYFTPTTGVVFIMNISHIVLRHVIFPNFWTCGLIPFAKSWREKTYELSLIQLRSTRSLENLLYNKKFKPI
jgi:hypothetical protein